MTAWQAVVLLALLGYIGAVLQTILSVLKDILRQLAFLRIEQAAGLGVNIDHPHGHLDGGHLTELRDDMRERRRNERAQRAQWDDNRDGSIY